MSFNSENAELIRFYHTRKQAHTESISFEDKIITIPPPPRLGTVAGRLPRLEAILQKLRRGDIRESAQNSKLPEAP